MGNEWTTTQIGALVVNLIVLVVVLATTLLTHLRLRKIRTSAAAAAPFTVIIPVYLWKWWLFGAEIVRTINNEDGGEGVGVTGLEIDHVRFAFAQVWCSCCANGFPRSSSPMVHLKGEISISDHGAYRSPLTCGEICFIILQGCLWGIWLHFLPCLKWTCDWGEGDEEGIRGAIWFISWAVISILLACLPFFRPLLLELQTSERNDVLVVTAKHVAEIQALIRR